MHSGVNLSIKQQEIDLCKNTLTSMNIPPSTIFFFVERSTQHTKVMFSPPPISNTPFIIFAIPLSVSLSSPPPPYFWFFRCIPKAYPGEPQWSTGCLFGVKLKGSTSTSRQKRRDMWGKGKQGDEDDDWDDMRRTLERESHTHLL